ncbi:MAG TPA: CotH kinase family protein, partial [Anaerolineae bacterium]|nr:CotH kinase family protein [Anaerolineae bacterium]
MRRRYGWLTGLILLLLGPLLYIESGEEVSSAVWRGKAPTFAVGTGYYEADFQVELQFPVEGARILYTRDGREPDWEVGQVYARPLAVRAEQGEITHLRARVAWSDGMLGPVASVTYFGRNSYQLPVLSLHLDPASLHDPETGLLTNPLATGGAWERPVVVSYLAGDRQSAFHLPAGVRLHGEMSRLNQKKGFRLYFRGEYGGAEDTVAEGTAAEDTAWLDYPLYGEGVSRFKRLVIHPGGGDSPEGDAPWTLLRNQLTTVMAAQLVSSGTPMAARTTPVLLFINGEPWGIYQLRERLDEFFWETHYGTSEIDLLDTPELVSGAEQVMLGDREHWDQLMAYVGAHDLSEEEAYAYVGAQIDIEQFIDYYLLGIYSANIDWPHFNVRQFRPRTAGGQWRWLWWDTDRSWGYGEMSDARWDMYPAVLAESHPLTTGRHTLLWRALLANDDFRGRVLTRLGVLLNTVWSSPAATATVDELAAGLAADIAWEEGRWPSEAAVWAEQVAAVREFVAERPDYLWEQTAAALGVVGETQLRVTGMEGGQVALGTTVLVGEMWEGRFFAGTEVVVTALAAEGYRFVGWADGEMGVQRVVSLEGEEVLLRPLFEERGRGELGPEVIKGVGWDVAREVVWVETAAAVDMRGWEITDRDSRVAVD